MDQRKSRDASTRGRGRGRGFRPQVPPPPPVQQQVQAPPIIRRQSERIKQILFNRPPSPGPGLTEDDAISLE